MMMIQTQVDMAIPFVGELPTVLRAIAQLQHPRPRRIVHPPSASPFDVMSRGAYRAEP